MSFYLHILPCALAVSQVFFDFACFPHRMCSASLLAVNLVNQSPPCRVSGIISVQLSTFTLIFDDDQIFVFIQLSWTYFAMKVVQFFGHMKL